MAFLAPVCVHPVQMGSTALHVAAGSGRISCLRTLLEAGASHTATDEAGMTPLHAAAGNGHLSCAEALLEAGADPEVEEDVRLLLLAPGFSTTHLPRQRFCLTLWRQAHVG